MIESIRYLSDVTGFGSLNDRINGGEVVEERVNGLRKGGRGTRKLGAGDMCPDGEAGECQAFHM